MCSVGSRNITFGCSQWVPSNVIKPAFLPVVCFSAEPTWHVTWLTYYWGINPYIAGPDIWEYLLTGFYVVNSPQISSDPAGPPSQGRS